MIDVSDWSRLGGLLLTARRLVNGLYAGEHGSFQRGRGLEFHEYRPYCPGDDVASIDWKLFGRTDRHYVRRHQQYTNLQVYLLIDCTGSMAFAGATNDHPLPTKLGYAKTLAAAMAYVTIRQGDRVGLGLFRDKIVQHVHPGGTWQHLQALCWALERTDSLPATSDAGAGLQHAAKLLGRKGLIVLISDLLDEPGPVLDGVGLARHRGFDVSVFQILTPVELEPALLGDGSFELIDPEGGMSVSADTSEIERGYTAALSQHLNALRSGCTVRGADYELVKTDQPAVEALRRYLTQRRATRAGS